ncbi:unnamed protein product [Microthlaspi erraticum]|uniref:F-box domain-containing protein n=1 Tax=Microthlaspi erraticum TaxID=1685480 RepID=A0A6D2JCC5_9BRAS|nr:unnamed protein product [Microthlaspi erraticum]
MDIISELPDELLVKVLSFIPTKLAVSTSILSMWMWLPKLDFIGDIQSSSDECERLRCFLDMNLPLHRAPIIESFRLKLSRARVKPKDVKIWVLFACSRNLRELEISYDNYLSDRSNVWPVLPSSLYICKSLVTLKLEGDILLDVPRMVCRSFSEKTAT